ncbi:MAG: FAD-dependent oxidoreductase [Neisseria sp.]|nr:FAD-dependent oxidoreductase [Neisseria sp.]
MTKKITRRDFLNGTALTIGSALLPWQQVYGKNTYFANPEPINVYPPRETGLRGDHHASYDAAHAYSWQEQTANIPQAISENYDLVIVGAGISGLSAAWFYRKKRPHAKILLIDNHDDFGGHAVRNEMVSGKTLRVTYGGSESFDSPKANFTQEVNMLMRDLGVDYRRFDQYFQKDLYQKLGLDFGIYFDAEHFRRNTIVKGDPYFGTADAREVISRFPMSKADQQALIALYEEPKDYLAGMSPKEKEEYADATSYYEFLKEKVGLSESAIKYLKNLSTEYWGYSIDSIALSDAAAEGYPGVDQLGLEIEEAEEEPYIYHFPDGNASIARLLVRKLIPHVAPGNSMEDVVLAKFDYSQLDQPTNLTRIRLNSTVIRAENISGGVNVTYLANAGGAAIKIRAKKCIMACHGRMVPYLVPECSEAKNAAFKQNAKIPMIYGKVLVSNWHAFRKMGTHTIYAPTAPYCLVMLDDPVNMGGYRCPQNFDEPIVIHMVRINTSFAPEQDVRTKCQAGRLDLYTKTYEELEAQMLGQLRDMYAQVGEKLEDSLEAVTINRWGHGYSYEATTLWDDEEEAEAIIAQTQKKIGNIHIANSDAGWSPYLHGAIQQAYRAVKEMV